MITRTADAEFNALSNALSFVPLATLLSLEIASEVCPDFYCAPVIDSTLDVISLN